MNGQWTKWEPIPGLAKKYCIESISDTFDEFKIILFDVTNTKNKVQIVFENSIEAFRITQESINQSILHDLAQKYGQEFYNDWTFFKATETSYLQWLSEQSQSITDYYLNFIQFSLIASNVIIDIGTSGKSCNPKVTLINNSNK